ncbi:MAG: response regulator [Tannerellaceae bacterium]|nr:response regulator [Tannerellaceae bacterium]
MKTKLSIIILILYNIAIQAFDEINFHVLDVKSGISDNYIQDILHDKYGFMWFATRDGLTRYDGYHFKNYTTLQLGAYNNNIEWVNEDASGNIWIKTPVNYCFYNHEKDELDNKVHIPLSKLGISKIPKQMFIDEDKNLWCVIDNTLYYYKFNEKKLLCIPIPGNIRIVDLTCRYSQAYLLLSDGNVVTVDWNLDTIRKILHTELHSSFQSHIYLDMMSHLWLYASHSPQIKCYSIKDKEWVIFPEQSNLGNDQTMITTVTDDGKGNVWIGTDNKGVFIYHYEKNKITRLYKKAGKMYSLPSNHITCIFKDAKDIMWIGTGKQGVAYSGLNNIIFQNNRCPQQEDVSCLLEDDRGNLWMGFDGEGIARYDKTTQSYTYFKSNDKTIPSDLIVCSFRDSKGKIWWGSFGKGAFYYENSHFTLLNGSTGKDNIDPPHYIRRITEDAMGTMWFATYTQGLYCLNTDGTFQSYTMGNSPLLTDYIADLSCVDGHLIYVATSSGVYCMDTSTRQLTPLERDKNGKEIIQDNFANCIYQDTRGWLWIGGRKGINIYDRVQNSLIRLDNEAGISHPYIRAIVEDQNGNMWVTTDHGITQIMVEKNPDSPDSGLYCYPYFEEDGIGNFTFNNFSIFCNQQNEVLAGGAGGYVKILPNSSGLYHYDRKVVFTEFYLANERVRAGTPTNDGRIILHKNIQLLDHISMNHSDNNFAFEVSAMDYSNLHKLQYLYRLGEKEEWIQLEGNRIYFNKLAPGTYHLQVKVKEKQAYEKNAIATLTIHVRPPFWLSVPAYFLYALFLTGIVIFIILRLKHKNLRILQQQMHDMEVAQQHEIDEAKLRFFTNVSHDLRTPLSLIITPLEKLLATDVAGKVHEELKVMHRNAVTLLDVINQLLDLRKLENGKPQLNLSHGDLAEFVKETCASFESYADKKNIRLQVILRTPCLETDFDKNKMQRILLNLLSNAFKYNTEHGSVTVIVDHRVEEHKEYARIQVIDTGIGIRNENKEKIFERFFQEEYASTAYIGSGIGMHIVKEYVSLHKGNIQVKDNMPQGTIFEITFPVQHITKENPEKTSANHTQLPQHPAETEPIPLLIVEDNEDFRYFIVNSLKEHYQVFDAENGEKALMILSQQDIRLVISDIRMPVMDGLELCNKIKTDIRYSHIPVILLTARTADEHVLEGLREGADDYIAKPFNLDILLLRICKLLEWSSNNHNQFGTREISPREITVSTLDEKLIEQAIQIVENNMDNTDFSVEDLSAEIGMSRGHLYKKLMTITGKSPIEFIRILRIKRGKQLLEQSQESISQIAYQVGLSPKQFAKYFKEEVGCLPSEYSKKK